MKRGSDGKVAHNPDPEPRLFLFLAHAFSPAGARRIFGSSSLAGLVALGYPRAEQKSERMSETNPLQDLDLETTIRLRWVLRDIRSRRTKLMAPNREDLALLEQRGLITMDDGERVLTDAANSPGAGTLDE